MKSLLLFIFALCSVEYSSSQDSAIVVNAGIKANEAVPAKVQYQYPEFLNGKVFFKYGAFSEGQLNYNRLLDEMHFISEFGDTLALSNEPTVRFVSIGKDTFCFDNGFVLLEKVTNKIKLAVKHGFRFVDIKNKAAAYDMMSSTSSVSSWSSYDDGNRSHQLTVTGQMQLLETVQYFFGDRYGHFVLATRKNIMDMFPSCSQLAGFIKAHKIDFSKVTDLHSLVDFLEDNCQ